MKTALITGCGRGIGKALAERFLHEGYAVIGTAQTGKVDYSNDNLKIYKLDLTSHRSIEECATEIRESGAKIDVHINNSGTLEDEEETAVKIDKLRQTLEVNLIGTIDLTEHVIPLIVRGGHIVSITSQAGSLTDMDNIEDSHEPYHYPAYKISKAALNMYTRTLAARLKHEGANIIVSSVHPGWVRTDMGGKKAPITPEEAAGDIFKLATSHPETGQFWYKGEKFVW